MATNCEQCSSYTYTIAMLSRSYLNVKSERGKFHLNFTRYNQPFSLSSPSSSDTWIEQVYKVSMKFALFAESIHWIWYNSYKIRWVEWVVNLSPFSDRLMRLVCFHIRKSSSFLAERREADIRVWKMIWIFDFHFQRHKTHTSSSMCYKSLIRNSNIQFSNSTFNYRRHSVVGKLLQKLKSQILPFVNRKLRCL